jgi:hypothetical protein
MTYMFSLFTSFAKKNVVEKGETEKERETHTHKHRKNERNLNQKEVRGETNK